MISKAGWLCFSLIERGLMLLACLVKGGGMPPMDPRGAPRGSEFVTSFGQAFDRRVLAWKRRFF